MKLQDASHSRDVFTRMLAAEKVGAPVEILRSLAKDSSPAVGASVASNPNTPEEILRDLMDDKEFMVICRVAEKAKNPELLERLYTAHSYSLDIKESLAKNRFTPPFLLDRLSDETGDWIREAVAGNPATPVSTLEKLARDKSFEVKSEVAGNPSSPQIILELLIQDEDSYVRNAVLENPSIPQDSLVQFQKKHSVYAFLEALEELGMRDSEVVGLVGEVLAQKKRKRHNGGGLDNTASNALGH